MSRRAPRKPAYRAELRSSFITTGHHCSGRIPGHTTRATPIGFQLETNGFQFYAYTMVSLLILGYLRLSSNMKPNLAG